MKRLIPMLILLVVTVTFAAPSAAQSSHMLTYGQTVDFHISDPNAETTYQFKGKAHDVIVVDLEPQGFEDNFEVPVLRLLNSKREAIANSAENFTVFGAVVALELPADDTYTLSMTQDNRGSGSDAGDYSLLLDRPPELIAGKTITDKLANTPHDNFYLVRQTGQPLTLGYRWLSGTNLPHVTVNDLQDSGLNEVIRLSGERLTSVKVALPTDADWMVIAVGDFIFRLDSDANASYQLSIA